MPTWCTSSSPTYRIQRRVAVPRGTWRAHCCDARVQIYRFQHTHGLPLQPLGDGSDPEAVLRDCADDHVHMRRVLCELREAVLEQVGKDQTDRLRHALADAVKALSA